MIPATPATNPWTTMIFPPVPRSFTSHPALLPPMPVLMATTVSVTMAPPAAIYISPRWCTFKFTYQPCLPPIFRRPIKMMTSTPLFLFWTPTKITPAMIASGKKSRRILTNLKMNKIRSMMMASLLRPPRTSIFYGSATTHQKKHAHSLVQTRTK